jgi:hypothetical protein
MKKISLKFIIITLAAICYMSCGNKSSNNSQDIKEDVDSTEQIASVSTEKLTIKPETPRITGGLEYCFEVEDKEYELEDIDDESALLTVNIVREKEGVPFNPALAVTYPKCDVGDIAVGFGLILSTSEGVVEAEVKADEKDENIAKYAEDGLKLLKLNPGKIGTLRFVIKNPKEIKNGSTFTIDSKYEEIE